MVTRPLHDDAEKSSLAALLGRCFQLPPEGWEEWIGHVGVENLRVVVGSSGLVGGLGFYAMGHWFGGRCVPCSGIAGVGVAAEARGTGASFRLLKAVLEETRSSFPLSALYPASRPVYRKPGYELAGVRIAYRLDLARLEVPREEASVRLASVEDQPVLEALHRARARVSNGLLERQHGLWERLFRPRPAPAEIYVVEEAEGPSGYCVLHARMGQPPFHDLAVRDLCWMTPRAGRRLLGLLAGYRTLAGTVEWPGPSADPTLLLLREGDPEVARRLEWMLRIADVPAALSMRGYPLGMETELHLQVFDDVLPWNEGRWVLSVSGGAGSVSPGGRGDLRVDVRGLAALYSGHLAARTLALAGRLEGGEESLDRATAVFAGPAPWMPDMF